MKNVSPEALSYCSNFYFTFSKTLRNQSVDLNTYAGATFIIDADGRTVYTRYVGEQHVKEDCNGYIPSAKEWVDNINTPTEWMIKTLKIED